MIVIDASSILELLLNTATGHKITRRISRPELELHAPELLDLEIAQALRRYERSGEIGGARGAIALENLGQLDIIRHPHTPFLPRIWNLRSNYSAYDAAYVALAEALRAPLLTCDGRLARAPGPIVEIELVVRSDRTDC